MNNGRILKILKLSRIGMNMERIAKAQHRFQQSMSLKYDAFLQSYEE